MTQGQERERRTPRWVWGVLALALLVGIGLRVWRLDEAGILSVDEGRYYLDALSKYNEGRVYGEMVDAALAERRGGAPFLLEQALPKAYETLGALHPFSPKLLYNYLAAGVMALRGPSIEASTYIEALFGILMLPAVFLFVRRLAGSGPAALATLFMSVSAYHLYYSRNAYPQTAAAFFVVLAALAHLRGEQHARAAGTSARDATRGIAAHCAAAGVFAGLSFWMNYQCAGALPALALVHLLMRPGEGWRRGLARFLYGGTTMAVGFFAVIVLAEAVTYPGILLFRMQHLAYPHNTFLELLFPRLSMQTGVGINWAGMLVYPYFEWLFEGSVGVIALVALIASAKWWLMQDVLQRRGGVAVAYLWALFMVPWFVFSVKTMQGARMFIYVLPVIAAAAGMGAYALWTRPGRGRTAWRVAAVALVVALIGSNLWKDAEILRTRSAYPQLIAFLKAQGEPGATAGWSAVLESYLRQNGLTGGALGPYLDRGEEPPRYFVSDWQELYDGRYPDESGLLPSAAQPVAVFEHEFGPIFLQTEAFPSFGWTPWSLRWTRGLDLSRARKLLVYDLRTTPLRTADDPPRSVPELWQTFPRATR